jgi:hypothetical protein
LDVGLTLLQVRETMRLYPPVEHTGRMAMADDILPLSEPFVDKKGRVHEGIPYVFATLLN